MERFRRGSKKTVVGFLGGLVVVIGLVLIPYPGPGWLVVFTGLAILASEFKFASRILQAARAKYDLWVEWIRRQPWYLRIVSLVLTCAVVVLTVWLVNGFGILAHLLDIDISWVTSPLFR